MISFANVIFGPQTQKYKSKKVNVEWKKSWFSNIPYMTASKGSPKVSEFTPYDIGRYDFLFK